MQGGRVMSKENTEEICSGLDCKKPARNGSAFCSNECREKTQKEMDTAPYGDQYQFPTLREA